MIHAVHTLVYADDPEAARAFFRDVLEWPYVDDGGGWLIFRTGPSELGVHPAREEGWSTPMQHQCTLMCDDLAATVAQLEAKGAEFSGGVVEESFGLSTTLPIPGAGEMMLYEPRHRTAYDL